MICHAEESCCQVCKVRSVEHVRKVFDEMSRRGLMQVADSTVG